MAEHSYFVTLYALEFQRVVRMEDPEGYIPIFALLHDLAESATGDIPAPVKTGDEAVINERDWLMRVFPHNALVEAMLNDSPVNTWRRDLVKVADTWEAFVFLQVEANCGNTTRTILRAKQQLKVQAYEQAERFQFLPAFLVEAADIAESDVFRIPNREV